MPEDKECHTPATSEAFRRAIEEETQAMSTTLNDVYEVVERWLQIRIKDRNRIDVMLATKLSEKIPGTPVWMIVVGNSGDWKTAFARSFSNIPGTIKVDQLTENTLASGKKGKDLGNELQGSSHTLLFLDLASLISVDPKKKSEIWAQFRNLYDGFINKRTGSGISRAYEGCHVTLLACATDVVRNEILLAAHLGTRELMYDTDTDLIDNYVKMDRAIENADYEEKMELEISRVVNNFIFAHKVKNIKPNDEMKKFLMEQANRLSILRAVVQFDYKTNEPISCVKPEVPTRLIKQFYKLYRCLKSLDENYPDDRIKEIILHIVESSGDEIRQKILDTFENTGGTKKIQELREELRIGYNAIKRQCELLWNLGILDKQSVIERVGSSLDRNGNEYGGIVQENHYYTFMGLNFRDTNRVDRSNRSNSGLRTLGVERDTERDIYHSTTLTESNRFPPEDVFSSKKSKVSEIVKEFNEKSQKSDDEK